MNMDARAWIEAYGQAWRDKDDDAAARLFTEDGLYRVTPFRDPHHGRAEIRAYWRRATSTQQQFDLQIGEPVMADQRATVEWWATFRDADWEASEGQSSDEVTLVGSLLLRFTAEGLCEELREYWHVEFGRQTHPPSGWGA